MDILPNVRPSEELLALASFTLISLRLPDSAVSRRFEILGRTLV
jgi:hypothetical protein